MVWVLVSTIPRSTVRLMSAMRMAHRVRRPARTMRDAALATTAPTFFAPNKLKLVLVAPRARNANQISASMASVVAPPAMVLVRSVRARFKAASASTVIAAMPRKERIREIGVWPRMRRPAVRMGHVARADYVNSTRMIRRAANPRA